MHWKATADTAEHFREGRHFHRRRCCTRDATDRWLGRQRRVPDAHNLAWKLAHVLNGTAGVDLLSKYER